MSAPTISLEPLRRALAQLHEAIAFWNAQMEGSALKPHLRSAVIQSYEYTYELAVRTLKRVLVERAESASAINDLSFNDVLRRALDAGFETDLDTWRHWRDLRNSTSHAYDEQRAQAVAQEVPQFATAMEQLLKLMALKINVDQDPA